MRRETDRAPGGGWIWLPLVAVALTGGCPSRERPPPEVPGVDLDRLTTEELTLYRRVLRDEVSPCGGGQSLEAAIRAGSCPLAPWAARFVAHRIEENDTREEIAERYLGRYGATRRQEVPVEGAPAVGPEAAPVTIVAFSDFTCPHCARAATALRRLVEDQEGRVRLVYRFFPLGRERGSTQSALAGLAAARQGRFWELHDALFDNQSALSQERLLDLAEEAGLDMDRFRDDVFDPALEAQLQSERDLGESLGVRGTPTIFVNGRLLDEPLSRLESAVQEELARAEMNRRATTPSKTVHEPEPQPR